LETFVDSNGVKRNAGDRWMMYERRPTLILTFCVAQPQLIVVARVTHDKNRRHSFGPCSYVPPVEVTVLRYNSCIIGLPALNVYLFATPRVITTLLLLFALLFYWFFFARHANVEPKVDL
jgi:hypothetical protein